MSKTTKIEPLAIKRDCYNMAVDATGDSGDIHLYGLVTEKRPIDYRTGEPTIGNYIVQSEFLEDLKKLKECKSLNIHLSSVGGMVSVGLVIHNKLREMAKNGVEINCCVDGVAMSAGSVIMCAADKIKVYPSSLVMIHKSSMPVWGSLNADELRKEAETLDAYDKAIIATYKRKTGKDDNELAEMMSAETYMTGTEAVEKGFADELLEGDGQAKISASADKTAIVVNGLALPLCGAKCPENIPVDENTVSGIAENTASITDTSKIEGGNDMADINKPAVQQAEVTASEEQISAAVLAERDRLSKIDAIAAQFSADIVAEAKYTNPCTAEELAYRAALANAKKGTAFLADAEADVKASGAEGVTAVASPEEKPESLMTDAELLAKAKAEISAIMGGVN